MRREKIDLSAAEMPATADVGSKTADTTRRFLTDQKLRVAGWTLWDRPKGKEAVWRFYVKGHLAFQKTQSEALVMLGEACERYGK